MNPYSPPTETETESVPMGPQLFPERRIRGLLVFAGLNTGLGCWLFVSWIAGDAFRGALIAIYSIGCLAIFLWESWRVFRDRTS